MQKARNNFGKLSEVIPPPNLIENQIFSFNEFLQLETPTTTRDNVGLEAVFRESFPVESNNGNFRLEYLEYGLVLPKSTELEAIREGTTFAISVMLKLRLREKGAFKDEEIMMGEVPMITDRGSFIVNGAERVVVSQLHRSPGICFEVSQHTSGKTLHAFRIIPDRGTWIEVQFDQNDLLWVYLDRRRRRRKFLVTTLLRAFGYKTIRTSSASSTLAAKSRRRTRSTSSPKSFPTSFSPIPSWTSTPARLWPSSTTNFRAKR